MSQNLTSAEMQQIINKIERAADGAYKTCKHHHPEYFQSEFTARFWGSFKKRFKATLKGMIKDGYL